MLTVTLLGTGDAAGIPTHGCHAPPCEEARQMPWLRRRQTCVLIQSPQANILLDMGNEAHMQSLYNLHIDAVFITHLHQDHYSGLNELQWSQQYGGISVYYPEGSTGPDTHILEIGGSLKFHAMDRFSKMTIKDVKITSVPLNHGTKLAQGYVIECGDVSAALLTDTLGLPDETFAWLADNKPDLVMIDACFKPGVKSSGHNNIDTAIETIQKLDIERAVLVHIAPHNWPYAELVPYVHRLDGGRTVVSYDGMILHVLPKLA